MKNISAAALIALVGTVLPRDSRGSDLDLGYNLHSNVAGLAHEIAAEASFDYFETGFSLGYGAKPLWEEITTPQPTGGKRIETRIHHATAFRLDAPLRLKYGKWPYLLGMLGYERILKVPDAEETLDEGFGKGNDISIYYGAGWAWFHKAFGIRLEMAMRSALSDADKTRFYRSPTPDVNSTYSFKTAHGSMICWQVGLRYRFRPPAS